MKIFEFIKLNNIFKNLLILIPFLVAGGNINPESLLIFGEGFTIFFFLTTCCYIINNFTDRKIDRINILKKKKYYPEEKEIFKIFLFFFTLFLLSVFYFKSFHNYFLYLYILNFVLYNFYFKQIFLIDILFLTNFYLIRLLYGVQIFDLDFSSGFFIFFVTIFLCLSLGKRIIQINVNKLAKENRIIPYSIKDKLYLKRSFLIFLSINFLTFLFFFIQNLDFIVFETNFFLNIKNYNNFEIISLLFFYSVLILRLFFLISKDLIKKDIYEFFLKDKITLIVLFIVVIELIYLQVKAIF